MESTIGEKRVRVKFNPGNDDRVHNLKEAGAHLIDRVESFKAIKVADDEVGERNRCIATAQTKLEEAMMWAVKAATFTEIDK